MENKISSQQIYSGAIINVTLDDIELENGKMAKREVVHHNGGVGILTLINHQILLVKQFRYAQNEYTIEIPAGKIELGENPYNTAMREIEEETGYSVKELKLFSEVLPTPGYCTEKLYLYEAFGVEKVPNPLKGDEDEFIDLIFIDLDEAYQMVLDLKIRDAKTIIAIMYAYQNYRR